MFFFENNYQIKGYLLNFSQQIRFKADDGSDFSDWDEKKLGEVTKYVKGFAFKSIDYQNSGVRIVRVSDLSENKIK